MRLPSQGVGGCRDSRTDVRFQGRAGSPLEVSGRKLKGDPVA